jgi:predicted esterase
MGASSSRRDSPPPQHEQAGLPHGLSPAPGTPGFDHSFSRTPLGVDIAARAVGSTLAEGSAGGFPRCLFQRVVHLQVARGNADSNGEDGGIVDYSDESNERFKPWLLAADAYRTYCAFIPNTDVTAELETAARTDAGEKHSPGPDEMASRGSGTRGQGDPDTILWLPPQTGQPGVPELFTLAPPDDSQGTLEDRVTKRVPLVVLFHGTDELSFDQEMMIHEDTTGIGRESGLDSPTTWLDLAEEHGFVVLAPQARGQWGAHASCWRDGDDALRTLWLTRFIDENTADVQFVSEAIDDLRTNLLRPRGLDIDPDALFAVGFSNGGFFASDMALWHHPSFTWGGRRPGVRFNLRRAPDVPDDTERDVDVVDVYRFAAVCAYMGGTAEGQADCVGADLTGDELPDFRELPMDQLLQPTNTTTDDAPEEGSARLQLPAVRIVTAAMDPQIFSCFGAFKLFVHLGYEVFCTNHVEEGASIHEYRGLDTSLIWRFFEDAVVRRRREIDKCVV